MSEEFGYKFDLENTLFLSVAKSDVQKALYNINMSLNTLPKMNFADENAIKKLKKLSNMLESALKSLGEGVNNE
jgi:hypothetical protein